MLRHAGSHAPMLPVHEHNEAARASELARRVAAGETIALVSDAGAPSLSDPGVRVVRAVADADLPVVVIPGPSAVVAALVASGFRTDPFMFVGFVPRKAGERRALIERLDGWEGSVVAFESPNRVAAFLAELAAVDPQRPVAVCRELTKLHEEVLRGSAAELARRLAPGARGEVTVVIGPSQRPEPEPDVAGAVGVLLGAGLSAAKAAEVAAALGLASRNAAYREALAAASRTER